MTDLLELPALGVEEFRAATIDDISTARREITVIAVPYDEDADIVEVGRRYTESFARTAFAGVQRRITGRSKVTVNFQHDRNKVIGKVVSLEPNHRDGLHATMRLTRGLPVADETLALAADDVLGASISFSPLGPDGDEWSDDGARRRVHRAYLHHIALVDEPAYEGGIVTSVRRAELDVVSATPWLDEQRARRRREHYASLLTP